MNYNDEITTQLNNTTDPCGSAVGTGFYRRVKWELYNPTGLKDIQPGGQEEWETEIIDRNTHLYTKSPFGEQSTQYTEPTSNTGSGDDNSQTQGIWCSKLGIYFSSQSELEEYVSSIGATLLSGNDWYGADISKSSMYKTSFEKSMYLIENAGGTYTSGEPRINARSMLSVDDNNTLTINFDGLGSYRRAYLKYYDTKPCTYVGIETNTDVSVEVPGTPVVGTTKISTLDMGLSCVPIVAQFPYSGLYTSIVSSWNTSVKNAKLDFSKLSGLTSYSAWKLGTIYEHLSNKMEELGSAGLAIAQECLIQSFTEFKQIISQGLSIVGGGWDTLKSFLPTVSISGISIDIENFCLSGVKELVSELNKLGGDTETVINNIYDTMGVTYDYASEYVKMEGRDLLDAVTEFYDWCWSQLLQGGVAICKFFLELAIKWTEPPPNPLYTIANEVKDILSKIDPLEAILSGNFPGFTGADIYNYVKSSLNSTIDKVNAEVLVYRKKLISLKKQIVDDANNLTTLSMQYNRYLQGLEETISNELTQAKKDAIAEAEGAVSQTEGMISQINSEIDTLKDSIKDLYKLGIQEIYNFPLISDVKNFLSMVGIDISDLIVQVDSTVTSMYKSYSDAMRQIKDSCKYIYNQVSTLSLSKVTQWIGMLLKMFGLYIVFPEISLCIPVLKE